MSYPQQHQAQRPPPLRQYNNPPPRSVTSPGGYSQDGSQGGYSDGGISSRSYQQADPGYDDAAYSYHHARCAHRVHQAREMGDLQALDTMIGVAILLAPVEDHRRNRGQEHLVDAHPPAVPSTIPFPPFPIETPEIRGPRETRETLEALETLETLETRGIGAVRHREG
ncbi:hypothetical protein N7465_002406 [Penicillium sp. CMV-2018d]|nr:hypothetical protein N7465_002406 [Penicillium sp. CMV-2018d]